MGFTISPPLGSSLRPNMPTTAWKWWRSAWSQARCVEWHKALCVLNAFEAHPRLHHYEHPLFIPWPIPDYVFGSWYSPSKVVSSIKFGDWCQRKGFCLVAFWVEKCHRCCKWLGLGFIIFKLWFPLWPHTRYSMLLPNPFLSKTRDVRFLFACLPWTLRPTS